MSTHDRPTSYFSDLCARSRRSPTRCRLSAARPASSSRYRAH